MVDLDKFDLKDKIKLSTIYLKNIKIVVKSFVV